MAAGRPGREGRAQSRAAARGQRHDQVRGEVEDVGVADVVGERERPVDEEQRRQQQAAAPVASHNQAAPRQAAATPGTPICWRRSNQYIAKRSAIRDHGMVATMFARQSDLVTSNQNVWSRSRSGGWSGSPSQGPKFQAY